MKEIAAGHAVAKRRGAIGIQANHEVPPDRSAESFTVSGRGSPDLPSRF